MVHFKRNHIQNCFNGLQKKESTLKWNKLLPSFYLELTPFLLFFVPHPFFFLTRLSCASWLGLFLRKRHLYLGRVTVFPTRLQVCSAKTQISQHIRTVWCESSHGTPWVGSKASTDRQRRLWSACSRIRCTVILVFAGHKYDLVGNAEPWVICFRLHEEKLELSYFK